MAAQFTRGLLVGVALFTLIACTPVVAPGAAATPEAAATPSPQSEALPTAPAAPATTVPTPETEEEATGEATEEVEEETMTPPPANTSASNAASSEVAALAQADLAERLSLPVEQIEVQEVRAVTWPDAGLGCPQPDMMYAQVETEGWLIRLSAGGEMYFYHSGSDQKPFLCETLSEIIPNTTPKADELLPPPGRDID